jgi:hypothetical protein
VRAADLLTILFPVRVPFGELVFRYGNPTAGLTPWRRPGLLAECRVFRGFPAAPAGCRESKTGSSRRAHLLRSRKRLSLLSVSVESSDTRVNRPGKVGRQGKTERCFGQHANGSSSTAFQGGLNSPQSLLVAGRAREAACRLARSWRWSWRPRDRAVP